MSGEDYVLGKMRPIGLPSLTTYEDLFLRFPPVFIQELPEETLELKQNVVGAFIQFLRSHQKVNDFWDFF